MLQHRELAPVAVAALLLLGVVATDQLTGDDTVFVSLLVTAPLFAAAFTRPAVTGVVGGVAALLALVLVPPALFGTANHLIRVTTVASGTLLAVFVAARRERREQDLLRMTVVADVAQNAVLWPVPARVGDLCLAARYVSASVAARIGGDLYEVVHTEEHGTRLLIGDVRGKGLAAVRLASAVLGCFREVAHTRADLVGVHEALEATVRRAAQDEDFVTAVLVEVRPDSAELLGCGHPPPLLVRDDGVAPVQLTAPGLPLGLSAGLPHSDRFDFPPGARLLLHTDGLLEARDAAGRFFPVLDHAELLRLPDLDACLDALLERVRRHSGGQIGDDVALLIAERLPRPPRVTR